MKGKKVEMELTDFMLEKFKDTFDMEIEFLQGKVEKMPNGMWKCEVYLSGIKLKMFEDFVKMIVSRASDQVKVKIIGVEIQQN